MIEYVELADRVFKVEVLPETEGYCPRTVTISVESGPPLEEEEALEISKDAVAELVARGIDVTGWESVVE